MEDDFDNVDNIANIPTYADFLDKFVTDEDRMYLEDEELARDVKELYAVNKGEIRNKADFERKKREIEEMNREEDTKERPLFSLNMNYRKGSFLDQLKERESEVRNGRKSTIIFIRYKDKKGKETSAYIDYRERLKNDEMEGVFKEGHPLLPKITDLSYYNWTTQKVNSTDSTFFRVDAGHKERLSFKNNTDRKIINVDLEYIEKIAKIISDNSLSEITLSQGDDMVTVRKEGNYAASAQNDASQPVQQKPQITYDVIEDEPVIEKKGKVITSPMVGTFYAASSPESAPFVEVGSTVGEGDVVCIIEAMKLMNEIKSEQSGKVVQICVKNGDPVEFGQVLMYVE